MLRSLFERMAPAGGDTARCAVIDIGSNSLRLVIWAGLARVPSVLLNEKVNANLGRTMAKDGQLPRKAMEMSLAALRRFVRLIDLHRVETVRVVATAAVRDASNGEAFLQDVRALGLEVELLSGEAEAEASAMGVISAFPDADGIVGDLGGGSLELIDVKGGIAGRAVSFPWGTLRLPALRAAKATLDGAVRAALDRTGWLGAAEGRDFYLVGGSWRALTQVAMHDASFPLLDAHGYEMAPAQAATLVASLGNGGAKRLSDLPHVPGARVQSLPDAAALLAAVTATLRPKRLVTSSFGLREGLLFASLDKPTRALDPLLASVDAYRGARSSRAVDGAVLAHWIEPLFASGSPDRTRLRLMACHLARVVQQAPGEMRAQRAIDLALHMRWIGLRAPDRAMVGAALLADVGERALPQELRALCGAEQLDEAMRWGQAMRFGRKFCGNAPEALSRSSLTIEDGALVLTLDASVADIYGESAQQQHRALANLLGLAAVARTH